MNDIVFDSYLNKIFAFDEKTGCIPAGSRCYCYRIDGEYFWVAFKEPILGRSDIKLHSQVLIKHGRPVHI